MNRQLAICKEKLENTIAAIYGGTRQYGNIEILTSLVTPDLINTEYLNSADLVVTLYGGRTPLSRLSAEDAPHKPPSESEASGT